MNKSITKWLSKKVLTTKQEHISEETITVYEKEKYPLLNAALSNIFMKK